MALLYFLLALALAWSVGALQLWPRTRWTRELPLWLGGALALAAAVVIGWGFVGLIGRGAWQGPTTDQAMHWLLGPGSAWFQRTGWGLLDRMADAYVTLDFGLSLACLAAASMHGYVVWTGVAERRRVAGLRRR